MVPILGTTGGYEGDSELLRCVEDHRDLIQV